MPGVKKDDAPSPIGELLVYHLRKPHVGRNPVEPAPHQVYVAMTPGEPYTAPELAEEWGVTRHTMLSRLEQLHEDGFVEKKELGATTAFWKPRGD